MKTKIINRPKIILLMVLFVLLAGTIVFTNLQGKKHMIASAAVDLSFNADLRHEFRVNGNLVNEGTGGGGHAQSAIYINAVSIEIRNNILTFTSDALYSNAIREQTLMIFINGELFQTVQQSNPASGPVQIPTATLTCPFSYTASNLWDRDCNISFYLQVISSGGGAFWDFRYYSTNTMNVRINTATPTGIFSNAVLYPDGKYYSNSSMSSPYFSWDNAGNNQPEISATINGSAYGKNAVISTDGTYSIVIRTEAGKSTTYTLVVDKTPPTNAALPQYTNKSIAYSATDSLIGVSKVYYRKGNTGGYTIVSGSSVTVEATGTNSGVWYFYAEDAAGNTSSVVSSMLDITKPVLTAYGGTNTMLSGSYTNKNYVSFAANDTESGISGMYVRLPNADYVSYTAGTAYYQEGMYYFYATDKAGNIADTVNVMLDVSKPAGTLTANGLNVLPGNYTNKSFYYTAADSVSGISGCEVKRPNGAWETYTAGTAITATSANGWYYFRATDRAGNISDESRICLLTAAPVVTLYAAASAVPNGTYSNIGYVSFTAASAIDNIISFYVRLPESSVFTAYEAGTLLYDEGLYFFYAVDAAGNISETVSITLDMSNPVGTITAGGTTVQNGDYINETFRYSATDAYSGISRYEIKRLDGAWQVYNGEEILAGSGNGWYYFRAYDRAGNTSEESKIYLLTSVPTVQLYANEQLIVDGTYTSAARISMSASGGGIPAVTCYVKLPGANGFTVYTQYFIYSATGRYEFYAEDSVGNNSGVFSVIVDRTEKPLILSNVTDGKTVSNVTVTWESGNIGTNAPIVSVMLNGKPISAGTIIKTIDGGTYLIESIDAAGNVWTNAFTAKRTEVLSSTLNKQYYETVDGAGNCYAFESYAKALAFAKARESALVRTSVWNGATWNGGIPMDSIDSANAQNGIYYIYKKSGDKNTEVAYFTLERLNAVITEYALETVSEYYWWQKTPAQIYEGNNLYALTAENVFVGESVKLADNASYLIDGQPYLGFIYSIEGVHVLTVLDDFGNSYEYTLVIVRKAPDIFYALGESAGNQVTFDRSYYFNAIVTVTLTDAYDEFAMFNIYAENGKLMACLSLDELFTFDKSGKYTVQAVNHFGVSGTFTLYVSIDAPKVEIAEKTKEKQLEIKITESIDAHSHLQTLEIYKSTDGGKTWTLIYTDDYGNAVTLNRRVYLFRTTGLYKVVLTDEFRSGIDSVIAQFDYTQAAPAGTLTGVENDGYTNGVVSFQWTDDAIVTLTKDGERIHYISGQKLTEDGSYILTIENYDGYKAVYSFVIDTVNPALSMHNAENGLIVNKDVWVTWDEENLTAVLYKNGKLAGAYESGTILPESGKYRIVVTDAANNVAEVSFTIDKIVDFSININNRGLANSVTVQAEEALEAVLTKDGEVISYTFGSSITAEGLYILKLTDEVGNSEEISFAIVKSLTQHFEYNFDNIPGFEKVTVNGEETRLNYGMLELKSDGTYEVGVIVNGISYNFTVTVIATAPVLTLGGVENGGTTKGAVTLSEIPEHAEVKVFLNGTEIEYEFGGKLTKTGKYRVILQDQCGNITEYSFEILPSVNGGVIALIVIAIIALLGVGVFLFLKKTKKI